MTLPLLAFAASLMHMVSPSKKNQVSSTVTSTSSTSSNSSNIRFMITGMMTGAGLYAFLDYQIRKWRIRERARISIRTWLASKDSQQLQLNDGSDLEVIANTYCEQLFNQIEDNSNSTVKYSSHNVLDSSSLLPTSFQNIRSTRLLTNVTTKNKSNDIPKIKNDATIKILVSPRSGLAMTSSLYAVILSIPNQCKMSQRESKGVELYYVLQGDGLLCKKREKTKSKEKVDETNSSKSIDVGIQIKTGDTFIVNPWRVRWLVNENANGKELVVLRISDSGNDYCSEPPEEYDSVSLMNGKENQRLFTKVKKGVEYMLKIK